MLRFGYELLHEKADHAVSSDDISSFVAKDRLTDEDRANILTKHFTPEQNQKGPLRQFGEKMRRMPALVFDKDTYPTLSYSESEDSVYCADCVAFSPSKVILSSKGLTDWKNAKKQVDNHLSSSDHKTAHL